MKTTTIGTEFKQLYMLPKPERTKTNEWGYKMEYKKVENEIDMLLKGNGLNTYERKLLRKVKEKLSKVNHELRGSRLTAIIGEIQFADLYMKNREIEELNARIKRMNRYFALNIAFFIVVVIGILMK